MGPESTTHHHRRRIMNDLSLPFGLGGEIMTVNQETWRSQPAVGFNLPDDGRLIAREHIPGLIEWLQGFMEETKPPLPTLPHTVIRATVIHDAGKDAS
jgi:hypothetical protein